MRLKVEETSVRPKLSEDAAAQSFDGFHQDSAIGYNDVAMSQAGVDGLGRVKWAKHGSGGGLAVMIHREQGWIGGLWSSN